MCVAGETTTAAHSMHPTGIHSCFPCGHLTVQREALLSTLCIRIYKRHFVASEQRCDLSSQYFVCALVCLLVDCCKMFPISKMLSDFKKIQNQNVFQDILSNLDYRTSWSVLNRLASDFHNSFVRRLKQGVATLCFDQYYCQYLMNSNYNKYKLN